MTRDDIIRMAREVADIETDNRGREEFIFDSYGVERFANLVAAAEREACAKVCEDSVPTYTKDGERWLKGRNGKPDVRLKELAPNLEAAWEQEQLLKKDNAFNSIHEGHILAAAIRARRKHG